MKSKFLYLLKDFKSWRIQQSAHQKTVIIMDINEKILQRRKQLGLSDVEVAEKAGIGIYAYGDLEAYEDEATTVASLASLSDLKRLCKVLDLNLTEFLNIPEQQLNEDICSKPRNVIVREMRQQEGLSEDELGDKVGFFTPAIISMESDPDFLESWCVENILVLAGVLDIPVQLLLDVESKIHYKSMN